jgi:phosphoribosylformylglycinamidine synthase
MADIALKKEGDVLIVLGHENGHLGQSLYQELIAGKLEGAPPPVDLADEIKAGRLVRALIREDKATAVHDVSDGGLLVAIAEMALAGNVGVELFAYEGRLPAYAMWFGEDQGRYVLSVDPMRAEEVLERARLLALPARIVARTGGEAIALKDEGELPLAELRTLHEAWLPHYMGAV